MPVKPRLITAGRSDRGLVRGNNEDAISQDADLGLLILADGMGGYNAGEVASGVAVSTILETVRNRWNSVERQREDPSTGLFSESLLLRDAVQGAHRAIQATARNQPECAGMGTTVVCCLSHDSGISIAFVGDSRCYRRGPKGLEPLTRDHSLLEELVAKGYYEREEAERVVRKNIVTRALGVDPDVEVEVLEETLAPGETLLLCSDGLTDMVSDTEIDACLARYDADLEGAAQALVDLALAAGGRDNVSVLLARSTATPKLSQTILGKLRQWI